MSERQPVPGVYGPDNYSAQTDAPPQPGETVVLMAGGEGWNDDTATVTLVKTHFEGGCDTEPITEDGEWLVETDSDYLDRLGFFVQRGPDGRWWSYSALQEYEDRTGPGAMARRRLTEEEMT
jgi:hypothetical protein